MRNAATWTAAIDLFVLWLVAAGASPGTVRLRTTYLRQLERFYPGRGPFTLTEPDLVAYLASRPWAPETRKSARAAMVAFYGWAHEAGHADRNPAVRLPGIRVPAGAPRPVPDRVLLEAYNRATTDRERLMLLLATYAGLRRGEIARVHPRDFTDHGLIVRGKGGRERLVPVHPDLAAAVRAEVERRRDGYHGTGWRYDRHVRLDGPLFPGLSGTGCSPDNVGAVLSRLLGPGWTAHTLRHRFASKAYAAERDLRAVQELLGHSKPETTARYVQVPTDAKHAAVLASGLIA